MKSMHAVSKRSTQREQSKEEKKKTAKHNNDPIRQARSLTDHAQHRTQKGKTLCAPALFPHHTESNATFFNLPPKTKISHTAIDARNSINRKYIIYSEMITDWFHLTIFVCGYIQDLEHFACVVTFDNLCHSAFAFKITLGIFVGRWRNECMTLPLHSNEQLINNTSWQRYAPKSSALTAKVTGVYFQVTTRYILLILYFYDFLHFCI